MKFFFNGKEFYDFLEKAILKAKQEICISCYAFCHDPVGKRFFSLLQTKAESGVKVRLLIDGFGSHAYIAGERILKVFRPWQWYFWKHPASFWHRCHARIFLIDRKIFGCGGLGIGKVYEHRRDFFVLTKISRPRNLGQLFERLWEFSNQRGGLDFPPFAVQKGVSALISGPRIQEQKILEWLFANIRKAQKEIMIVTAWFFPPQELLDALRQALQRGVSMQIVTPLRTDHLTYDSVRALPILELVRRGAVWRGSKHFFHSKFCWIDQKWCMGSANFDIISLKRNYELNLVGKAGIMLKVMKQEAGRLIDSTNPRRTHPMPLAVRVTSSLGYRFLDFLFSARQIFLKK